MPNERNTETSEGITREIKALRARCAETYNIIENSPLDTHDITQDNVNEKTLCYIEGLATEIDNSNTLITTDDNLLTGHFLHEIKQKISHVQDLSAYTKGAIHDVNMEIIRLETLIGTAQQAKSCPAVRKQDVQHEHLMKAKERFQLLKNQLHGLLKSLFPSNFEMISEILGELMLERMDENSNGYIPVTVENYHIVKLLTDMNIVSINPYNDAEFNVPSTSFPQTVVMTYINITSVKLFVKVQNVFGVCKVFACLVVIGGGIYEIARGNTENLNKGFEGSTTSAGGIALALYSGLWAYDGWNSVTVVTEEIINPSVNVPLSISIAVPLITALYVFMNVAYMTVLSYAEMTSVPAVAVAFGTRVLGPASFLIPLGVAVATFGCAMSVQFGVTRVCYTAARGGHMLEAFSYVNIKRLTPAPAVALQALLTTIFILVGNIKTLIEFASWFLWFFYGLAMVALLVLRKTQADKPRPYRVPTPVPCFVLLVAIFLSVLPIVHDPSVKYLMAVGSILIGVAVYTVFVYYKKTPTAIISKFTFLTQVLFESVPPSNNERQD